MRFFGSFHTWAFWGAGTIFHKFIQFFFTMIAFDWTSRAVSYTIDKLFSTFLFALKINKKCFLQSSYYFTAIRSWFSSTSRQVSSHLKQSSHFSQGQPSGHFFPHGHLSFSSSNSDTHV